ncbi:hypothetical protein EZJ49_04095 [Bdellovibrio bacteriovorus]|nr:hypothetical protein [Bdellovibrio bacteriovorus]UXR65433.1 hypothetical protein EZJ49_04095 [Bdellovibrio bacteriovorus]
MRSWDDVIKGELFGGEFGAAVLAGVIVADINVFPAESDGSGAPWSYIGFQS